MCGASQVRARGAFWALGTRRAHRRVRWHRVARRRNVSGAKCDRMQRELVSLLSWRTENREQQSARFPSAPRLLFAAECFAAFHTSQGRADFRIGWRRLPHLVAQASASGRTGYRIGGAAASGDPAQPPAATKIHRAAGRGRAGVGARCDGTGRRDPPGPRDPGARRIIGNARARVISSLAPWAPFTADDAVTRARSLCELGLMRWAPRAGSVSGG